MAYDRWVVWNKERPTRKELTKLLLEYVDGAGEVTHPRGDGVFFINFPTLKPKPGPCEQQGRWIEVWHTDSSELDVKTRMQDNFVNAVAEGLAKLIARHYRASLDQE